MALPYRWKGWKYTVFCVFDLKNGPALKIAVYHVVVRAKGYAWVYQEDLMMPF